MRNTKITRKIGEINVGEFDHINPGDLALIYLFDKDRFAWLEDQYLKGRDELMDTEEFAKALAAEAARLVG